LCRAFRRLVVVREWLEDAPGAAASLYGAAPRLEQHLAPTPATRQAHGGVVAAPLGTSAVVEDDASRRSGRRRLSARDRILRGRLADARESCARAAGFLRARR